MKIEESIRIVKDMLKGQNMFEFEAKALTALIEAVDRFKEDATHKEMDVMTLKKEIEKREKELPRKAVMLFAQAMERKLKKNDYKGGWEDCSIPFLIDKLNEESKEFQTALDNRSNRMLNESADVANILMMLCDICERLEKRKLSTAG